jgi:hypothetical protein
MDSDKEQQAIQHKDVTVMKDTKDLGFIPTPKYLRYNPTEPFHFGLVLNCFFGFASTFSALNVTLSLDYQLMLYSCCQPLLLPTTTWCAMIFIQRNGSIMAISVVIAASFGVDYDRVSRLFAAVVLRDTGLIL